ncbi:polynucleotide adenylyltransferase PcnB [Kiritimatiella glycovorans]|uniref:Poly(A) polymerase I n=1 Tax=Kiritimatiella glycovorans TaxID=1307763 RepID=A0A0G3EKI8_9BACT|nr:polynucleotide adenylyltransferase PcnB [Kiritimatiella glycovorans]AKJ64694.1 Poly(A) polymerase I precursor [Kiritimatiella glycovorans]
MDDRSETPAAPPADPQGSAAVIDRGSHPVSRRNISSAAIKVLYRIKNHGHLAYLAGGGVRDLLLNRTPKDFDIATDATPEELRAMFNNSRIIGRRFRLVHVLFRGEIIEVSTFRAGVRAEDAEQHSDHAFRTEDGVIVRDNVWGTAAQDALRRDFTVNALFYNIADFSIIDYVGGLEDIDRRTIRVIGDPTDRFTEDPVRMIRAIRFAATLGFDIEETARRSIGELGETMQAASPARLYEEVRKLFLCGNGERVFELLSELDFIEPLFPELGEWLKDPEGEAGVHWIRNTFRQLDRWVAAGLKVDTPLMFALLFGAYHERRAETLCREESLSPAAALQQATHDHILQLGERIAIPKNDRARIARIMALQPRFRKTTPSRVHKLERNPQFLDAWLYFKFAAKTFDRDGKEVTFWEKRHRGEGG